MKEEFKDINYKGLNIRVSNYGKVIWNGVEKPTYYNHDGYAMVSLKLPNIGWRSVFRHVLVAIAFIPNPNNYKEVNHIDYDRANPKVDNLEWVTRETNIRYSIKNRKDYTGSNNPNYGNRTLSNKYKNNKELAKEKQGRPGIQNGRCRTIDVYYDDVFLKSFKYIKQCCQYFIDSKISKTFNPESVRSQINKCIKENRRYKQHYTFVKR